MEQECILLDDTKQELQILIGTKCTISYKDRLNLQFVDVI